MVDDAFRRVRDATTVRPCAFEMAIAARCAACAVADRRPLGEHEVIGCSSAPAHADCAELAALLRERAMFALRLPHMRALPHSVAMRLACGGIAGLRQCVAMDDDDVRRLVAAAKARWGSLADLPWAAIVASTVAWQGRRRSSRDRG